MKNFKEDGNSTPEVVVKDTDGTHKFASKVQPERSVAKGHSGTTHNVASFHLENTTEGLVSRGVPTEAIRSGESFVPVPTDPERTARELSALWADGQAARGRQARRFGRSRPSRH